MHRKPVEKSAALYAIIVSSWIALTGMLFYSTRTMVGDALHRNPITGVLVITSIAFIAYFWLNGVKDLAYTLFYHLWLKSRMVVPAAIQRLTQAQQPYVEMLYTAYNDFNAAALLQSMQQDYHHVRTVILDDSTTLESQAEIDAFAREHRLRVVRRSDNEGFKAGNLNHFLQRWRRQKYFVLLDADEVIPRNFIQRMLDYFAANPKAGIVQASHRATRNRTPFMQMFARGVDSHWPTYQGVKHQYGFMSLLGHGAMISRECYDAVGQFPHTVAEDICFSIEARQRGYLTLFAPDIVCEEEFPVDYHAFKKRHGKWTEGNMEFVRQYSWRILTGKMRWYEKMDIVLFTFALPLTALFSLYVIINAIIFPAIGYTFRYPVWMLVPTCVFLVAPMLNDVIVNWKKQKKRDLASYLAHSTILFGSMYFVSLRSSLKSAFGRSVFHVTPKSASRTSFMEALRLSKNELLFGTLLGALVTIVAGSILPIALLALPAVFAPYLAVMHNQEQEQQVELLLRLSFGFYVGQVVRQLQFVSGCGGLAGMMPTSPPAGSPPSCEYMEWPDGKQRRKAHTLIPREGNLRCMCQ